MVRLPSRFTVRLIVTVDSVIVTWLPFTVTVIGTGVTPSEYRATSAGYSPPRHFQFANPDFSTRPTAASSLFHLWTVCRVTPIFSRFRRLTIADRDTGRWHPLDELPHPLAGRRGVVSGMELTGCRCRPGCCARSP